MPVKVTTAPMSVRPRVKVDASAAVSNGSSCRRMVAAMPVTLALRSTAGHRRKKGDLAGTSDRGLRLDVGMVDGRADHLRIFERMRIVLAAPAEPGHQVADSSDASRYFDVFLRLADPLAHPRKIQKLHAY